MYLVSSKSLLHALIFGIIAHKGLIFYHLHTQLNIQILFFFFTKKTMLDTTILSKFTLYMENRLLF